MIYIVDNSNIAIFITFLKTEIFERFGDRIFIDTKRAM
ncbi:hypothetical protein EZS27_023665 [termite gut metagenome]|uniref:Uncharacterized protein n=1 Tax=termite gut metagenome TaxID=433724 RepID=A0A5J4R220_9ZZZZ